MVRTYLPQDFAAIADVLIHLRTLSEWEKWPEFAFEKEDIVKWLLRQYQDHMTTCLVNENDGVITEVIGVSIESMNLPPHLSYGYEWCLWGADKRNLVDMWKQLRGWAKARGAVMMQRASTNKHFQTLKWEKL